MIPMDFAPKIGSKRRRLSNVELQCEDKQPHYTVLGSACLANNLRMVKVLLEDGADMNKLDRCGWTPLMLAACANGNGEVAMYLIDQGADHTVQKSNNGYTALSLALREENYAVAGRMQAAIMARYAIVASPASAPDKTAT